jgi:hypothetical protein
MHRTQRVRRLEPVFPNATGLRKGVLDFPLFRHSLGGARQASMRFGTLTSKAVHFGRKLHVGLRLVQRRVKRGARHIWAAAIRRKALLWQRFSRIIFERKDIPTAPRTTHLGDRLIGRSGLWPGRVLICRAPCACPPSALRWRKQRPSTICEAIVEPPRILRKISAASQ